MGAGVTPTRGERTRSLPGGWGGWGGGGALAPPASLIDVRGQQDPAFLAMMMVMVIAMITLIISGNLNFAMVKAGRGHDPRARELKERKYRIWKMINLCTGRVELQRFSRSLVLLRVYAEIGKKMGKAFLLLKENPLLEG